MKGEESSLAPLPVPSEYHSLAVSRLDASAQDVAYLYAVYAHYRKNGTAKAINFKDAVLQHHLIDEIVKTSETFSE